MVSLCLTQAHIDSNISGALSATSSIGNDSHKKSSSAQAATEGIKSKQNNTILHFKHKERSIGNSWTSEKVQEYPQLHSKKASFSSETADKTKFYGVIAGDEKDEKYKSARSGQFNEKVRQCRSGSSEEKQRRSKMLSTLNKMGVTKGERLQLQERASSRFYKQNVTDARNDPYRIHKWRIRSGRFLDHGLIKQTVHSQSVKQVSVTQKLLPPILFHHETAEGVLPKVDKSHNRKPLGTVLESKQRTFGQRRDLEVDGQVSAAGKLSSSIMTRLRNHVKTTNIQDISTAAHFQQEIDARGRMPSGLSDFSTPENLLRYNYQDHVDSFPESLKENVPTEAQRQAAAKYGSSLSKASFAVLPPIITVDIRHRRKSYPVGRRSTIKENSKRHSLARLKKVPLGTISSIPEHGETHSVQSNVKYATEIRRQRSDSILSPTKDLKRLESNSGLSPTNKTRSSSLATNNLSGSGRSGSKEGKDGDTPTDSEESYGGSKYRRNRKTRGSRMLSMMESRNSPGQYYRNIKPSRMDALMGKWYIVVKLSIWLSRLYKAHGLSVDDTYNIRSGSNVSGETETSTIKREVLFDVTDYKMKNQLRLSDTVRRILCLPSNERTENDLKLVQTALRNIKAISDYSNAVQRQIGSDGYFVGFDGKKVIVREGKRPLNYYILMAGSAVVIKTDELGNTNPVQFMKRGDVFGSTHITDKLNFLCLEDQNTKCIIIFKWGGAELLEHEILEDIKWRWSVATSGYCEFLVLTRDAYQNIFITGGGGGLLTDPDRGGFLRSISLLQQWPAKLLNDNPNRCLFRYFKRGALLVNDHTTSEWIYVVKSGSCSVMKTLMVENLSDPEVLLRCRKEQTYRSKVKASPHLVEKINQTEENDHLDLLSKKEEENKIKAKEVSVYQQLEMSSILKELNSDVMGQTTSPHADADDNDGQSDLPFSSLKTDMKQSTIKSPVYSRKQQRKKTSEDISKYVQDDGVTGFRMSRHSDRHPPRTPSPMKAAYLQTGTSPQDRQSAPIDEQGNGETVTENCGPPEVIVTDTNDPEGTETRPLMSGPVNDFLFGPQSPVTTAELTKQRELMHPVHLNVRCLTKGNIFGICPTLYSDQPSLALVSNGAECLMLNKKFYLDNATEDCLKQLRETEYPYPSENELMEEHTRIMAWRAYQAEVVNEYFNRRNLLRSNCMA